MLNKINKIPFIPLVIVALMLGLAPFFPEPHLLEKTRMLLQGDLQRPLDIFDLLMHATPVLLLALRLTTHFTLKKRQ